MQKLSFVVVLRCILSLAHKLVRLAQNDQLKVARTITSQHLAIVVAASAIVVAAITAIADPVDISISAPFAVEERVVDVVGVGGRADLDKGLDNLRVVSSCTQR